MTTRQDLTVRQGETFSYVFTYKDNAGSAIDLTGYTARAAIKRSPNDGETPTVYFSTGSDADGGTITLGGAAGTVTLAMTAAQTQAMLTDVDILALVPPEKRARHYKRDEPFVWDLEIEAADGTVTRLLEGRVIVQRGVSS